MLNRRYFRFPSGIVNLAALVSCVTGSVASDAQGAAPRKFSSVDSASAMRFVSSGPFEPIVRCGTRRFAVLLVGGPHDRAEINSRIAAFEEHSERGKRPRLLGEHSIAHSGFALSGLRWQSDCSGILYLAPDNSGVQQAFQVTFGASGSARQLSFEESDVCSADLVGNTLAIRVDASRTNSQAFLAREVGLRTLPEVLGVRRTANAGEGFFDTYLIDLASRDRKRLNKAPHRLRMSSLDISLSPDGKLLAAQAPISQGSGYLAICEDTERFETNSCNPFTTSFFVVASSTSTWSRVADGISGWDLGSPHVSSAVWASGSRLVLPNVAKDAEVTQPLPPRRPVATRIAEFDLDRSLTRAVTELPQLRSPGPGSVVHVGLRDGAVWTYSMMENGRIAASRTDSARPPRVVARPFIRQSGSQWPVLSYEVSEARTIDLLDPNPEFAQRSLGHQLDVSWKDAVGNTWVGALLLPSGYQPGTRYPVVLQTRGYRKGDFLLDGPFGQTTASAARVLIGEGFVVLQIQAWVGAVGAHDEMEAHLRAYQGAVSALDRCEIADSRRVGATGFSRSTTWVRYALVHDPGLFKAAILADGVDFGYFDYVGRLGDRSRRFQNESVTLYGTSPLSVPGIDAWLRSAPSFQTDKVTAAVRFEAVDRRSVLGMWEFFARLREQGADVEFTYLEDGEHVLRRPQHIFASQDAAIAWYVKHLRPEGAAVEYHSAPRELESINQCLKQ